MPNHPYMTPRYAITDGGADRLLVEYTDDQPGCVSITEPGQDGRLLVNTDEIPALIEALRRIYRDTARDERLTERWLAAGKVSP